MTKYTVYHFGRAWRGTHLEDECPCQKAPCGLVHSDGIAEECPEHPLKATKTIRQMHPEEFCPELG